MESGGGRGDGDQGGKLGGGGNKGGGGDGGEGGLGGGVGGLGGLGQRVWSSATWYKMRYGQLLQGCSSSGVI